MRYRLMLVMLLGLLSLVDVFTSTSAAQGTTYSDPFAYCAAVGAIDAPDARYVGPPMPEVITRGLRTATQSAPDQPLDRFVTGGSWRCMDGQVYACWVGANLPCQEQADTSHTPAPGMATHCQDNPNSPVPGFVLSAATVYEWTCQNGVATPGRQVWQVDARGFIANIWYALTDTGSGGPATLPAAGTSSVAAESISALAGLAAGALLLGLAIRRRLPA